MTQNYGLSIVKDYPIKGVNFIDINGLLEKPEYFRTPTLYLTYICCIIIGVTCK